MNLLTLIHCDFNMQLSLNIYIQVGNYRDWKYEVGNYIDLSSPTFPLFVLSSVPHTRGHVYKLYKAYSSGIRSYFFCERVINVWNSLPADVDFSSVNTFKRGIECVDFTQFLRRCLWFVCMFFSFRKAVRAFNLACPAIAVLLQLIMSFLAK